MRRKLIAANWKMHGDRAMAQTFVADLQVRLTRSDTVSLPYDVLLCPATAYLDTLCRAIEKCGARGVISAGAQTVSQHKKGAFTGEISLSMLTDLGVERTLVGHSERREMFGESNLIVAEKFSAAAIGKQVSPILCMGETLSERQSGKTEAVIAEQLNAVIDLAGIDAFANADLAYEPVWAIGTGETATPEQAQSMHRFIRSLIAQKSEPIGRSIRILYGGSVKPANARELFEQSDIDGGLVGGASLEVDSFAGICEAAV